ncbi:MAG: tRNA epoxyqueuosine(34) reductase QueG [Ignavibacteriaceae bacterium]|nr:tRNA epoxyqueuosine(34) reductase QueG [Ignavibacteriaceae bacterium]
MVKKSLLNNSDVLNIAAKLGFTIVGFAPAQELTKETDYLHEWLASGYQAGMSYMENNFELRKDVTKILPSAKSIISLGLNYYTPENYSGDNNKGKVSRYAWGKDYHLIIWKKLDEMIGRLTEIDSSFEAKRYVDTGPVMDTAWAARAGLGWQGKHTILINRNYGSWFFIANIICNTGFNYSKIETDHCGSCTACIDACPTGAIVKEYVVDANKCISYLTIENKSEIPDEYTGKFDSWIFGCDVCQDVCPWNNKFSKVTYLEEFMNAGNKEFTLDEIKNMSGGDFKRRFKESPILRAKLKGLLRNVKFILGED